MAEVIPFPGSDRIGSDDLQRLLEEAAVNTDKLTYLRKFKESEEWYRLVTSRQVLKCLEDGKVKSGPVKDEAGNWRCSLYRLCAGGPVYIDVALHLNTDGSLARAYVLSVDNRVHV